MPFFSETHLKIMNALVVWDGITRPDTSEGGIKYTLAIVVQPNNPDVALFQQLAGTTLQQSKFQGSLPPNGLMPGSYVRSDQYQGHFTGWFKLSCGTTYAPDIYDPVGNKIDIMRVQHESLLYPGQAVEVLVHCYEYDNKNKGIAAGLDAVRIKLDANAPRLALGNSVNTGAAFGADTPGAPATTPGYTPGAPATTPEYTPGAPAPATTPTYDPNYNPDPAF